jgi:hypothetical protein
VSPTPSNLRPEATPLPYKDLTETQQRAYAELARMLADAAAEVPVPRDDKGVTAGGIALDVNRKSRVAVVCGERGSGKTTAVLSLVHDVSLARAPEFSSPKAGDEEQQALCEEVKKLGRQVIWLDVLDMAPLPVAANLFSGVLVRIEDAVCRAMPSAGRGERPQSFLASPEVYDSPLEKLRRLQTDVAVSWEGNLKERAGELDPSAFAQEVKRAESVRLALNQRLAEVLAGFAKEFHRTQAPVSDPLFVLLIDDFDLNPPRCLELLELLRTLSVPRLFCVALGHIEVAETMCTLQMAADVARVAGPARRANFLPLHEHDIQATVANVSGNVIRKLLPPNQRIQLLPLELRRAVNLRPAGRHPPDPTVGDLLKQIPLCLSDLDRQLRRRLPLACPEDPTQKCPGSQPSLHDLLFATRFATDAPAEEFYQARRFLEMPVRQLVDFWQLAQDVATTKGDDRERCRYFRKELHEFCRDVFRAEETLPSDARRNILAAFDAGPDANWGLLPAPFRLTANALPCRVRPEAGTVVRVEAVPRRPEELHLEWQVVNRAFNSWEFRGPRNQKVKPLFLTPATGYLLLLYTDLDALARGWGERNCLLELDHAGCCPVMRYRFQEKALPGLPWPVPPVMTFWELDRFLSGWNEALRRVDERGQFGAIPFLVLNWIGLGRDVLTGAPLAVRGGAQGSTDRKSWEALRTDLEGLERDAAAPSAVGAPVQRWLAAALSLLNTDVLGADQPAGSVFYQSQRLRELCLVRGRRFAEWEEEHLRREDALAGIDAAAFWRVIKAVDPWWGTGEIAREGQRHYYIDT